MKPVTKSQAKPCQLCHGSGKGKDGKACPTCEGKGEFRNKLGITAPRRPSA